ncbi:MAG: cysteine-rich CWC family protein [Cellvibrionaceae bacterium]
MTQFIDQWLCPLCRGDNRCGQKDNSAKNKACWCMGEDIPKSAIAAVDPLFQGKACICQSCARQYRSASVNKTTQGDDLPSSSSVQVVVPALAPSK